MPDTQPTATVAGQSIALHVTGYPDVPNRWGPGHIRVTGIRLDYGSTRTPDARHAFTTGLWVRDDGEHTDASVDRYYDAHDGDTSTWPDWIAELVRKHDPSAADPSPSAVDQTTRDRTAEAALIALTARACAAHLRGNYSDTWTADAARSLELNAARIERGEPTALLRRLADEAQQPAVGARQPDTETPTAPCSWVAVKSSHTPHTWAPQPGMDPVPCAGYTPPVTDQPTVEPERSAAADTDEAHVAPHCDGFPTTCPNPVTVPPAPPHHYGGIRCGCYDEEQPS